LAIAYALEASIDLDHNDLGCEHLLLRLLDDESVAGRVLQDQVTIRPARTKR
jgi:hypothetical protein